MNILVVIGTLVVFVILCVGIYSLFRGGDFARSYSNKLMRLRIIAQFIVVLLVILAFWLQGNGFGG